MKKRVGILTSGGDCPGLNATIRGVAKALYARMGENVEIVGILNGYSGLINGDYKEMCEDDFRGILTLGGTILGTKRTPFKMMRVVEDDNIDKVAAMKTDNTLVVSDDAVLYRDVEVAADENALAAEAFADVFDRFLVVHLFSPH